MYLYKRRKGGGGGSKRSEGHKHKLKDGDDASRC